jgi:UDP-N-acetyl-D-mannosaminuronic acid dehydrogenase
MTTTEASRTFPNDVVVIGGCGRVGLPLAILLAERGARTVIYDVSDRGVALVNDAVLPFQEADAEGPLKSAVASGMLRASTEPSEVAGAEAIIVVIGTPVDQHLNPDPHAIPAALALCTDYLVDGQLLVLRSTVFPGVTALVERRLGDRGKQIDVAFCPERIAEGKAMTELVTLAQLVGARNRRTHDRAGRLFGLLTETIVEVTPEEAELAKLFTNAWRYVKFATANQFYMIANDAGLDFERIRQAMAFEYPRAADLPAAGLAAGPCLFKDTMQLGAFNNNNFALGHSAMLINEGLPLYLVSRLEQRFTLSDMVVGILGMSFKAESDDIRSSLSYKLRSILQFKCRDVLTSDPYVPHEVDDRLIPLEEVVERADLLVIAAPHPQYHELQTDKPVIDVWNVLGGGVQV